MYIHLTPFEWAGGGCCGLILGNFKAVILEMLVDVSVQKIFRLIALDYWLFSPLVGFVFVFFVSGPIFISYS